MNSIKRCMYLALFGLVMANPIVAASGKNSVPSYIDDLYAAITTQSEANILDRMANWVVVNDYYKGKLAEYVALIKGQEAGYTKKSDLYAQAILIADASENPYGTALLKKRYEQCLSDEKFDILNPSNLATTSIPPYVQLLYTAASIQANASICSKFGSEVNIGFFEIYGLLPFSSNVTYKARLAEFAAIEMGKAAGVTDASALYAQAAQIANVIDNPKAIGFLQWKYDYALAKEKAEAAELVSNANTHRYGVTFGTYATVTTTALLTAIGLASMGAITKICPGVGNIIGR